MLICWREASEGQTFIVAAVRRGGHFRWVRQRCVIDSAHEVFYSATDNGAVRGTGATAGGGIRCGRIRREGRRQGGGHGGHPAFHRRGGESRQWRGGVQARRVPLGRIVSQITHGTAPR